jgi:hypothetical protein
MRVGSVHKVLSMCTIPELTRQLRSHSARVFVVREGGQFAVLLPEQLHEFARDEHPEKMSIAADLARRAPTVIASADAATLVHAMREDTTQAAVVVYALTGSPSGL